MTSPIVSDATLVQARAMQARTFDLTATVTREVLIDDGGGGTYPGTSVIFQTPCRISGHKSAAGEVMVAGVLQGQSLFDITMPALTDIRLADRITIVFSATDTRTYEVLNMSAPKSRETARTVLAQERSS